MIMGYRQNGVRGGKCYVCGKHCETMLKINCLVYVCDLHYEDFISTIYELKVGSCSDKSTIVKEEEHVTA